jgi:hypothetical protein
MKKLQLLLFALVLFTTTNINASHLMGGELTAQHISGNDYYIELTLYRDASGNNAQISPTWKIYAYNNTTNALIDSIITAYTSPSGMLLNFYPYNVEAYFFKDTITLPGPGEYRFETRSCCRNGAIQNLVNPLGLSMQLETIVTVPVTGVNSTPTFLVPASVWLNINTPWTYNPLPIDVDGDSLYWSIDTPLTDHAIYAVYNTPPGNTSLPFSIDSQTGVISWSANTLGNFQASILVDEFRNGVKIGQIRRDMQFIVVNNFSNIAARITNWSSFPHDANNFPHVVLAPNQPFQYTFLFEDPDQVDPVWIMGFGETFSRTNNPATLVHSASFQAVYDWTPTQADVRSEPYIHVLRLSDRNPQNIVPYFITDETFLVTVANGVGINETKAPLSITNIYPNPAKDIITISLDLLEPSLLSIDIYDITGRTIKSISPQKFNNGITLTQISVAGLSNGQYFIKIKSKEIIETKRFIINK